MRLVGKNEMTSPYLTAGRLEIFYVGRWGTVCRLDPLVFGSADTVCKILSGSATASAMKIGQVGDSGLG